MSGFIVHKTRIIIFTITQEATMRCGWCGDGERDAIDCCCIVALEWLVINLCLIRFRFGVARAFNHIISSSRMACIKLKLNTEYGRGRCLLQFWLAIEIPHMTQTHTWAGTNMNAIDTAKGNVWRQYVSCSNRLNRYEFAGHSSTHIDAHTQTLCETQQPR